MAPARNTRIDMHIAVITTAYKTPEWVLARTWASLKRQSYTNWHWLIYDDSPSDFDAVYRQVYGYQSDERYKVFYIRPENPSNGNIGLAKHNAFMQAQGDIFLELDHDDELTPDCLSLVNDFFEHDKCGFAYSDWCEILPTGESGRYPDGWAFGFGDHYWDSEHNVWAMKAPELNAITLSHIVSAPNHVRAWRSDVYSGLGGHNIELEVADDYDLVVRTALSTKCSYIPKMLYKQHIGNHSAQRQRNDLIQKLVAELSSKYIDEINSKYANSYLLN